MKKLNIVIRILSLIMLVVAPLKLFADTDNEVKTLVIYYSQTGATEKVAREIASQLNTDIAEIEAAESYGTDYDQTIQRWRKEMEEGKKVEILPISADLKKYDRIFLGFPIWGGTVASPIATFLSDNSLKDKEVITFATFGSGGIETATKDVEKLQPDAIVIEGYGVRNARLSKAPEEILRFLIEKGYKEGKVTPLPDYGTPAPVNNSDREIFDKACSGYKFPLGTPVNVAKRYYPDGVDYRFAVISKAPDDGEIPATIYVTVPNGEEPEFTRVVRSN